MEYFKDYEFECKCGCNILHISKELVKKLNRARFIADEPFVINSACRCPLHNSEVGGSPTSSHIATTDLECTAVDIKVLTHPARYNILTGLLAAGFTRIGIAESFIHVDVDPNKSPGVIWTY